jgi:hypothetical protein
MPRRNKDSNPSPPQLTHDVPSVAESYADHHSEIYFQPLAHTVEQRLNVKLRSRKKEPRRTSWPAGITTVSNGVARLLEACVSRTQG